MPLWIPSYWLPFPWRFTGFQWWVTFQIYPTCLCLNMYCINSSHHLNKLVIISVPVDTASLSLIHSEFMRKNFINRMLFNDDIYWLLMFYRQDCTLFTLMLILCVCIVCLHFIVCFAFDNSTTTILHYNITLEQWDEQRTWACRLCSPSPSVYPWALSAECGLWDSPSSPSRDLRESRQLSVRNTEKNHRPAELKKCKLIITLNTVAC